MLHSSFYINIHLLTTHSVSEKCVFASLLWSGEVTDTFGMLHLVFKGDRAPPLPGRIPMIQGVGGAI